MTPILWRFAAAIGVVSAIWCHGYVKGLTHAQLETERAVNAAVVRGVSIVRKVHEKIVYITRRAGNIAPNLERLCTDAGLSHPGGALGPSDSQAGHALAIEGLAREIEACLTEDERLTGIVEAAKK